MYIDASFFCFFDEGSPVVGRHWREKKKKGALTTWAGMVLTYLQSNGWHAINAIRTKKSTNKQFLMHLDVLCHAT